MKTVMIIASAISFIATPALAQDFGSTPSEKIAYGDLDLGSPGGKATLEQRIRAALRASAAPVLTSRAWRIILPAASVSRLP